MPNARQIISIAVTLIIGIAVGAVAMQFVGPAGAGAGAVKQLPKKIPIGGLFALSGPLSSYGKRHKAAAELAIKDINEYVAKLGYDVEFVLIPEDTKVEKEEALKDIQTLAAQGVKVVLGPLASSEVATVKGFADENEVVVISHSSTFPGLAVPDDFIFRFVPTDVFQGKALARVALSLGAKKVAVIYRGDEWGEGLYNAFKENFEKAGGVVKAVKFDPQARELSAEVRRLSDYVKEFGAGPDVAVLMISFEDDGLAVLSAAKDDPALMSVVWLGTDGTAMSSKILENAGEIVVKVGGLMSTIFGPAPNPKKEEFDRRMKEMLGEAPDPYSYNIYDAAWVAALAILEAGVYDGKVIKEVLPDVASRYYGVSGWCLLDEAGDRAGGDYLIYKIVKTDGGYEWVVAGRYSLASDSVTWFP